MGMGLLLTASSASGQTNAGLNASNIFARHFTALGGRPAVEQVQSVVVKGSAHEGNDTFNFELDLKPPGRILLVAFVEGGMTVRQGRSARAECWREDPRGVRELKGADAGELMGISLGHHLPGQIGMSERLAGVECEETQAGEREAVAIGKKSDVDNPFPRMIFDKKTGLLLRAGNIDFDDYRPVEGLRLPFRIRTGNQATFTVSEIRLNPPLEDSIFEKPKDTAARSESARSGMNPYATLLSKPGQMEIVRQPPVANFHRGPLPKMPRWDAKSTQHAQVDLRGYDLRGLDLSDRLADLLHADFDSRTQWPEPLPTGFDRARILELGRDPGLGVRELHRQGIVGKGIGIGIIDQALLVDHEEYRDRLKLYEEIHNPPDSPAQMHGPAVASIAVGKTTGLAPAADLYYIAETHGVFTGGGNFDWDFGWLAKSIHRLLDVNATLPEGKKIRVISISVGWGKDQKGYAETMAAVDRAKRESVFIVSTAIEWTYQLAFHGLGRDVLSDPNEFKSFGPGSWWGPQFWSGANRFAPGQRLLVPMDSRGLASPTGPHDYVFYWSAGWSWAVPWIAGLYALACEVKLDVTPEEFWAAALKTGRTIQIEHAGKGFEFGTIADPVALIDQLKKSGSQPKS